MFTTPQSRGSSVSVVTKLSYELDDRRSISDRGWDIFLLVIAPRPALEPTQSPIQWIAGVKRPEREADHSPPSSAEVKNA